MTMARPAELFADQAHVMKALFQEFSKRSDLDAIASVEQDVHELLEGCAAREADARMLIADMTRQVRELEASATYPHRESEHAERVAALQRQIDVARQLTEELSDESRSVEQQLEQLAAHLRTTTSTAQEVADADSAESSMLRHALSMYAHITRVTWRTDKEPRKVAGTVSDSKAGDIRMFEFAADSVSRFEMTNALWELL